MKQILLVLVLVMTASAHRYYDATTGRWISCDPAAQHYDSYAYASCNPVVNVDPTGLLDYIYTSQTDYHTENDWGFFEFLHPDRFFADVGGQRYLANSQATLTDNAWSSISSDWFSARMDAAMKNSSSSLQWIYQQSKAGGQLDQKQWLTSSSLYLYGNMVYNSAEAGNIVWGAAMERLGIPDLMANFGAEYYSIARNHQLDQANEVRAYTRGYNDQIPLIPMSNSK